MEKDIFKQKIEFLNELIHTSNSIVFFGGAGVSTESGIPDYRSKNGLYKRKFDYPLEKILSHDFFTSFPNKFYEFYMKNMNSLICQPNMAHKKLAELEEIGKLKGIITQNIDGLHQKAGSKNVLELHGTCHNNYCIDCKKSFSAEYVFNSKGVPKCDECGGIIRPDVVLYGEPVRKLNEAKILLENADLLIVGGTSLSVYPANLLIDNFRGEELVYINNDDEFIFSSLSFRENIGKVLSYVDTVIENDKAIEEHEK